jgi:hypothetical protein
VPFPPAPDKPHAQVTLVPEHTVSLMPDPVENGLWLLGLGNPYPLLSSGRP